MKRRYLVGYPFWNCVDMIPWLLEGIQKLDRSRVFLLMFFSNCPQETRDNFDKHRRMLDGYDMAVISTEADLREGENHNVMMEFLLKTDCDVLLAPQDDNKFMDGRILDHLDAAYDQYGDRIGVIGMRDGYNYWYNGMAGQPWSNSTGVVYHRILNPGDIYECILVNTGPWAYSRHTIETMGYNEPMPLFSFEDYCLRCHFGGKINLLLGATLEHRKFGRMRPADWGSPQSREDLARLNARWEPKIGHPVHG